MSDLRDLYQEVILDHSRKPRNRRRPARANRDAVGHNPLCGDQIHVFIEVEDGVVRDVGFEGSGCAISTASASMMSEALKGRTVEQAEAMFQSFHDLVTGTPPAPGAPPVGKLTVFEGVREFPVRVKCATLAWHTMRAAIESRPEPVTTEEPEKGTF